MSDLNEIKQIARAIQCAHDAVDAVARETVNTFHPPLGKAFKQKIADFIFHIEMD